jgi:hypothetical protein
VKLFYLAWWAVLVVPPTAVVLVRRRRLDPTGLFTGLILLALLFSPVMWPHGLLQAVLPGWLILTEAVRRRSAGPLLLCATAAVLTWPDPNEVWAWLHPAGEPYRPWETLTLLAYPAYALVLLYIAAAWVAVRPYNPPHEP